MRSGHALAAALCLAAAPLASAGEHPAQIAEARRIDLAPIHAGADATHELQLHLYLFRGTRWDVRLATAAALDSARLLRQCGVALASLELRLIDAPRRYHFYSTSVSRQLLQSLDVVRPAVFFVEDTRNRPAFDAEAIGIQNSGKRPELANTVWVAHGARDLPYALAHELVHVLSDSGEHSEEPGNLMQAETRTENSRLTGEQCERLQTNGIRNGLLKAR